MINITGSAEGFGGANVRSVEIRICQIQNNDSRYWTGTSWESNETWLRCTGTDLWFFNTTEIPWDNDSKYLISSRAMDNVDNTESPEKGVTILYDNKPPEISIAINDNATYTTSSIVTLNLFSVDSGIGVSGMTFSTDGTMWGVWEPYVQTKQYKLSINDGFKFIYFKVKDKLNNTAITNDSILLDSTAPYSLSVIINNGTRETNSTSVILHLQASDNHSGVHQMSFSFDSIHWSAWEQFCEQRNYTLPTNDGEKTLYFRVMDVAGNVAVPIFTTIILNTSMPDTDGSKDGGDDMPGSSETYRNLLVIAGVIIIIIILVIIGFVLFNRKKANRYLKNEEPDEILSEE